MNIKFYTRIIDLYFSFYIRLLSENITINQNSENSKNKNSIIKIAFKKSTNNFVNCYFTSKFKSSLSPSSNTTNE